MTENGRRGRGYAGKKEQVFLPDNTITPSAALIWPTMDKNSTGNVRFPDQGLWGFQFLLLSHHASHCDTGL